MFNVYNESNEILSRNNNKGHKVLDWEFHSIMISDLECLLILSGTLITDVTSTELNGSEHEKILSKCV